MKTADQARELMFNVSTKILEEISTLVDKEASRGNGSAVYHFNSVVNKSVVDAVAGVLEDYGYTVVHSQGSTYRDDWNYLTISW